MVFVGNRQSLRRGRWNPEMVESQPPNNPAPFRGTFVGRRRELGELTAALELVEEVVRLQLRVADLVRFIETEGHEGNHA